MSILCHAADVLVRRLPGMAAIVLLLAACNSVEIHTAATGTKIEARQVVAFVYAQAPDSEIDRLLLSGGDLTRAIKGLRDRYPTLKPWLDQGVIGNTAGGFVALRDTTRREQLHDLLCDENRNRAFLYDRASAAVGHCDNNIWLSYASYTFGREWIAQGQPGWWWQDEKGRWQRQ